MPLTLIIIDNFNYIFLPFCSDFYRKEIEVEGSPATLEILDTAGTEQFASMRDLYIRNGQGFILVFSISSQQTFTGCQNVRRNIMISLILVIISRLHFRGINISESL